MKLLAISLLSILLVPSACAGSKSTECVAKTNEGCICTKEYRPVCGCDDKTYGNLVKRSVWVLPILLRDLE